MHPRLRPAWPGARLAAPAFTASCPPGGNLALHAAVPPPRPGAPWSSTWAMNPPAGTGAKCSPQRPRPGASPGCTSTAACARWPPSRPTGDVDGVVVIAEADLEAVVATGRARAAAERMMFEELRGGATTLGLLGLDPTSVTGP